MEMGGADSPASEQPVVILIIISLWKAVVTLK